MKKTIKVVAAIIIKNNKILIAKRNYGEFMGLFEFPGGKINENESKESALIREIKEELSVAINIEKYFMTVNYSYPNFILEMDCYICSLIETDIQLSDHSELLWINSNEKEHIEWVPADIQIIDRLIESGY